MAAQDNSRGLHPRQFAARDRAGQFAPVAARFARAHRENSARARPSAWAVNSRGLHPRQFAPMGGKLRLRLCKRTAPVRGGCTPGNSRLGAVSCAHACTNRWRTCAAQCLGCQFALWAARFARAHRATSARARRGYLPGGAAGGIKQKEKRPWQTPLAFSL